MSHTIDIKDSSLADAYRAIEAFIKGSPFSVSGVNVEIGGTPLQQLAPQDLIGFKHVNVNLTVQLTQSGNATAADKHLVSSSLYTTDPDSYYNEVIAMTLKTLAGDSALYQAADEFLANAMADVLNASALRVSKALKASGLDGDYYTKVVESALAELRKDPSFGPQLNSQISQSMLLAVNNPVFLARAQQMLAKHVQDFAASRVIASDQDFAEAVDGYMQIRLEALLQDLQFSIARDPQAKALGTGGFGATQSYLRSKIEEKREAYRSKVIAKSGQNIDDVKEKLNLSLLSDEKLQNFADAYFQSKLNALVEQGKLPGSALAGLQGEESLSKHFGHEVAGYIAERIGALLQGSQLLDKSKLVFTKSELK